MRNVPVSTAKAELSTLLRDVKRGERVIITDRGVPVAALVPVQEVLSQDERFAELERRGVLIPPKKPLTREDIDFILSPLPAEPKVSSLRCSRSANAGTKGRRRRASHGDEDPIT